MRRYLLILPFLLMGCDVLAPAYNANAPRSALAINSEIC